MLGQQRPFVCSDFGWSILIGYFKDFDPGDVDPYLYYVKKGVPTSMTTGERRKYIRDGLSWSHGYEVRVIDHKDRTFVPRCLMPVSQHDEYYGVRSEAFLLSIRYKVQRSQGFEPMLVDVGYSELHAVLCNARITKSCGHRGTTKDSDMLVPLGPEVATTVGLSWISLSDREDTLPRICISLVQGDSRARWLALSQAPNNSQRQTVLRSKDCCIECALRATTAMLGKWVLIL